MFGRISFHKFIPERFKKPTPAAADPVAARVDRLKAVIGRYDGARLAKGELFEKDIGKFDAMFTIQGLSKHVSMHPEDAVIFSDESLSLLSTLAFESFQAIVPTGSIDRLFSGQRPLLQIGSGATARFVQFRFLHDPDSATVVKFQEITAEQVLADVDSTASAKGAAGDVIKQKFIAKLESQLTFDGTVVTVTDVDLDDQGRVVGFEASWDGVARADEQQFCRDSGSSVSKGEGDEVKEIALNTLARIKDPDDPLTDKGRNEIRDWCAGVIPRKDPEELATDVIAVCSQGIFAQTNTLLFLGFVPESDPMSVGVKTVEELSTFKLENSSGSLKVTVDRNFTIAIEGEKAADVSATVIADLGADKTVTMVSIRYLT